MGQGELPQVRATSPGGVGRRPESVSLPRRRSRGPNGFALLDATQGDDAKIFTAAARGALEYALAQLARPDGTFAAEEDATADEFAGYYAWTEFEIDTALGADAAAFKRAHGVESAGNVLA